MANVDRGFPGLLVLPCEPSEVERSLGWQLAHWCETFLCHGPGDIANDPLAFDEEFLFFWAACYSVNDVGRRNVRRAILSRPKGRAKSELAAAMTCGEMLAPVRFDHWAKKGETSSWGYRYQKGEPVGRRIRSPFARLLATEEGQTGNTYDAVQVMLEHGLEKFPDEFGGIDVGLTRTFLPGGGEIRPSTAGASSKDGGKETFAVADEDHLLFLPELVTMHKTVARNLTKRKIAEPWMLETSTMYQPGQNSVAEVAHKYAKSIAEGKARNWGLLFDHREGSSPKKWSDDRQVMKMLRDAYGPASSWTDFASILGEIRDPKTTEAEGRRYFGNLYCDLTTVDSWLPSGEWETRRRPGASVNLAEPFYAAVDMALKRDTTALRIGQMVGEQIVTQDFRWEATGASIDILAVEEKIRELHATGHLVECAYDPAYFAHSAAVLADEGVSMVEFPQTSSRMVPACGHAFALITAGLVEHDDDATSAGQVTAAAPVSSGEGWRLSKGRTRQKIDSAIALVMVLDRVTAVVETPPSGPWFAMS